MSVKIFHGIHAHSFLFILCHTIFVKSTTHLFLFLDFRRCDEEVPHFLTSFHVCYRCLMYSCNYVLFVLTDLVFQEVEWISLFLNGTDIAGSIYGFCCITLCILPFMFLILQLQFNHGTINIEKLQELIFFIWKPSSWNFLILKHGFLV